LRISEVNACRAALLTPALVDLTKRLGPAKRRWRVEQVALMSRLSRERPAGVPLVHGFVLTIHCVRPFTIKHGPLSPLAVVEKAIMQQGFIGVKLYPPMGFRASNNAAAGNAFHVG
jgi:hypothetical protein